MAEVDYVDVKVDARWRGPHRADGSVDETADEKTQVTEHIEHLRGLLADGLDAVLTAHGENPRRIGRWDLSIIVVRLGGPTPDERRHEVGLVPPLPPLRLKPLKKG